MLCVKIDSREKGRVKSATHYYKKQGIDVEVCELPCGDYIFSNETDSIVFELKFVSDFVSSIQSGRVFNQAINQAENYNHHFVIIVGDEHNRSKALAMSRNYQRVTVYQYLSAIASLNRYTTVIESYSQYIDEAYARMMIQAKKILENKPIVKKFPRKDKNPALNFLMYTVYGISAKKAMAIVTSLNLNTLTDLQSLTLEKLQEVDGIGKKNAQRIIDSIK